MNGYQVIKDFQGLIGAALAFATAVFLVPRVGDRYARSRDNLTRRMDLAIAVGDFAREYWKLGEAKPEMLEAPDNDFQPAFEEAVRLHHLGRLLQPHELTCKMLSCLHDSFFLPPGERYKFHAAVRQFIESEARGEAAPSRVRMLEEINGVFSEWRTSPGVKDMAQVQQDIVDGFLSDLRSWSIGRPWKWPAWWRTSRSFKRATASN